MATAAEPMTTETLLALPEDGVESWLVAGELRERPMTIRNRFHARGVLRIGYFLERWCESQTEPRGRFLSGEVGVRLAQDPDTTVGINVVYISAELAANQPVDSTIIEGVPTFAVEILSPNDTIQHTHDKVELYLNANVPLVWVVDPYDRAVRIYRPEQNLEMVNLDDELNGEPELSGFCVPVAELFC